MEEVKVNGFAAFTKYMGDPDVMELMGKFQNLMLSPNDGSS
jgi:small glutamine-rich tetratricopeptide repeat-containing protein alpha